MPYAYAFGIGLIRALERGEEWVGRFDGVESAFGGRGGRVCVVAGRSRKQKVKVTEGDL
jgi:hypothetical protein